MFAGATVEVRQPVTEEHIPQELGVSRSSRSLTTVEAQVIRKCKEAMATHMSVASAAEVPVGPKASMPGPALAVVQAEPAAAKPVCAHVQSLEVNSEASTETNPEQVVQAAMSPEEALEIVQSPHAPTPEPASVTNHKVPRSIALFPFIRILCQYTPMLGFFGI